MAKTRIIQRTPNLGLTLKMTRPGVAPVASAPCCEPEIGPARWLNPATGAYDLETQVIGAYVSDDYLHDVVDSMLQGQRTLCAAQVTGDLCDCAVSWARDYARSREDLGDVHLETATPDRALCVGVDKTANSNYGGGVLTATATVTCRDGATTTLAPIYLVINASVDSSYCLIDE